jgi:AcrR family transcriptional regulator
MAIGTDPTIRRQVMASARAVWAQQPGAPISAIVERAGVSRATFYRHFGSRSALAEAVAVEPPAPAAERILAAAAELIGPRGLSGFSMEQLASASGVSRATLYRLYPNKAAIFAALLRTQSPFREMVEIIDRRSHEPPEVVLPALARAIAGIGPTRVGILRSLLVEAASASPIAIGGVRTLLPELIGRFVAYMLAEMDAGRIRRMHPVLAMQCLMGPLAFHLLTRPVSERVLGFSIPVADVAEQVVRASLDGLLLPAPEADR